MAVSSDIIFTICVHACSERFRNSRADMCMNSLSAKSTIFIGRLDFDMTVNIRYDTTSKINSDDRKFGISYICQLNLHTVSQKIQNFMFACRKNDLCIYHYKA